MEDFFELSWLVESLSQTDYKRIALQLPDKLLNHAPFLSSELNKRLPGRLFFVLADSSFGSCCVDEVAAQRLNADCLVHFGFTCYTCVTKIPVFYVHGAMQVAKEFLYQELDKITAEFPSLCLFADSDWIHCLSDISKRYPSISIEKYPKFVLPGDSAQQGMKDSDVFVFLGSCGDYLTYLRMKHNKSKAFVIDLAAEKAYFDDLNVNRLLVKRLALVEKAKEANIIGILCGSLNISRSSEAIERIEKMTKTLGKKSYQFVIGKLNVQKLGNFPEIDVFVYVACPFSTLIDQKEFFSPLLSPFEFDMAFRREEWAGDFSLNLSQFIESNNELVSANVEDTEKKLIVTNSKNTLISYEQSPAGYFLLNRSYQGLEHKSHTSLLSIIEGKKGIAKGYDNESK